MTTTLLPEFVLSGLAPVEKALRPEPPALPPGRLRDLFFLCCSSIAPALRRHWEEIREGLGQGLDGKRASFQLRELSGALDVFLRVAGKVLEAARVRSDPYQGKETDVEQLESVLRDATGMRDEVAALLRWVEAPPPRLGPAAVEAARGPAAENYRDVEEVLARLRSGEDL